MINKGLFTSTKSEWETPQELFDELDREFHFLLDACATEENAKCKDYYSKDHLDGLTHDWHIYGSVFMNPPYGREIGKWVKRAYEESQRGCTVVCLLPSRTDTRWWHDYCMRGEIRFIKGRLKFRLFGESENSAPFPSAIVIFRSPE